MELPKILKILKYNPYMYQKMENNQKIRRFFIQKYVILYKINSRDIIIERIVPQKSNYNQEEIYKIKFPKTK